MLRRGKQLPRRAGIAGLAARVLIWAVGMTGTASALAAWQYEAAFLGPGRVLPIIGIIGTGHSTALDWAVTPEGILRYSLDGGVVRVIDGPATSPRPLYEPLCATGGANYVAVADAYDGLIKVYGDQGGFRYMLRPPGGELVCRLAATDGLWAACYDFQTHQARLRKFSFDGYLLSTISSDASSPGRWDWIFDFFPTSTGVFVYAYEGDGASGKSWVEQRSFSGTFVGAYQLRDEGPLPPLWYVSRSLAYTSGATGFFALVPGSQPGSLSLLRLGLSGAVERQRDDVATVASEPWLRLMEFTRNQWAIYGMYPTGDRPGRVYLFDSELSITAAYQQTPGPADRLWHPRGVMATPDGRFMVSDTDNWRVSFHTALGTPLSSVVLPVRPGPIAPLPDGRYVVINADQATNPSLGGVLVLGPDGAMLGNWGPWGSASGQLAGPMDVDVGPGGEVYVADTLNNRVQVFTADGALLRSWGWVGEPPSSQFRPKAIAVGGGRVFTAEDELQGGRVLVFTCDGAFLRRWTVPRVISDLEAGDGGTVYAYCADGRVLVLDEFGEPLDSTSQPPSVIGALGPVGNIYLGTSKLYVADTANSRIVVFREAAPTAAVTDFGPTVLPLVDGARVALRGEALPADLQVWLGLSGGGTLPGRVVWCDPGGATAEFDTSATGSGVADLWVAGSGLPATKVGQIKLRAYFDPSLVGLWGLVDGTGVTSETLTISLTGQARYERLDATGSWRQGRVATDGSAMVICYAQASADQAPGTAAYQYSLSGGRLTLVPLLPCDRQESTTWQLLAAQGLIEPSLSGLWRLSRMDEGSGLLAVPWTETLRVDLSGAYLRYTNRRGVDQLTLGQMQAYDGNVLQNERDPGGAASGTESCGTYELSGEQLIVRLDSPTARTEEWQRAAGPGRRPLLWCAMTVPPRLHQGMTSQGQLTVGNHGTVEARQVSAQVALPWAGGGSYTEVAYLPTLGPGQTHNVALPFTPPADWAAGPVRVGAAVVAASPEAQTARVGVDAQVISPQLDMQILLSAPAECVKDAISTLRVTVRSLGLSPAQAIPADRRTETAIVIEKPSWWIASGGPWRYEPTRITMTWQSLIDSLGTSREVTLLLMAYMQASVGTVARFTGSLLVPEGIAEASVEDNVSRAETKTVSAVARLRVGLQPTVFVRPGSELRATITLTAGSSETLNHRQTILVVDSHVNLAAASPGQFATIDLPRGYVIFTRNMSIGPGKTMELTQALPVAADTPTGTLLTFRAVSYCEDLAPIESDEVTVIAGAVFGDLDGDGQVSAQDLAMFIVGWKAARQGIYTIGCDLAPMAGTWPAVVSQPDGVIDWRDAEAMLQALLHAGG